MALRRGVVEWEALCRVRAVWVRVWWGAFCMPGRWPCYTVALLYSGSVAPWDGVKKSFSALLGIFYGIRILRYLYLSKVFISLLFRQLLRHKVLAHECNTTFSAISVLG